MTSPPGSPSTPTSLKAALVESQATVAYQQEQLTLNEGRIDDLIQQVEQEMEGKEAAQSEIEATKKNLAASDRSVVHNLQRADNLQQRFDDNVLQLDEAKKTINDLTAALAAGSGVSGLTRRARHVVGKPATFSHMTTDLDVRDWLSALQNYLLLTNAPQDEHVLIASSYLGGEALRYFQNEIAQDYRHGEFIEWEHFAKQMQLVYGLGVDDERARHDLDKLFQTGTVREYAMRFKLLLSKLGSNPISEADKVFLFRKGLKEPIKRMTLFVPGTAEVQRNFVALVDSALAMAAALEVAQGSATGFSAPNTSKRQGAAAPAPQSKKPRTQANHPPGSAAAVATALRNDQARSERLKTTKGCYRCEWPGHRNLPDNRCDSTQVGPPANNKWRLGPKGEAGWKALKDDDPTKVKPLTAPQ
jgi:hypothetical protein